MHAGSYDAPGYARDVYVSNGYAFVANDYMGFEIIDVSDPWDPTHAANYDTPGVSLGVYVSNNIAYVADITPAKSGQESNLLTFDVYHPTTPVLEGACNVAGYTSGVYVVDGYAYVAGGGSGLLVVDVHDPASPFLAGSYNDSGFSYDVYVSGELAYVAEDSAGLRIVNVSHPDSPTLTGVYDTPGNAYGLYVINDYAHVADGRLGLRVVDVSNPAAPVLSGSLGTPDYAYGVFVANGYAFVASGDAGLQIVDVSDPAAPFLAGSYDTPGYAFNVHVSDGYAYVADAGSGLQVISLEDDDGDGLSNLNEYYAGTDPCDPDTDGDGMEDGWEEEHECLKSNTIDGAEDYDGDGLSSLEEYGYKTSPCDPDTDADGADDFTEVNWPGESLDPLYWDSDGDALPDGFEANNYSRPISPLDPADSLDGADDFDGDSNPNVHEYWNGTDPWAPSITGGVGCHGWGDSGNTVSADGLISPLDIIPLLNRINLKPATYTGVIPYNGDSQELDMDEIVSPLDLSILKSMVGMINTTGNPSIPADLEVSGSTMIEVEVGYTRGVSVGVANNYPNYTSSIGVVFTIDAEDSTGTATLLGGEGPSGPGRYDVSGAIVEGGRSTITLRADSPGTIFLNAEIPPCGNDGLGRYCPGVVKTKLVTIVAH